MNALIEDMPSESNENNESQELRMNQYKNL
jgi:hypothetical protein